MDEIVDKVKNDIESFLMEDMENHEMEIDYILYNPKTQETQVLASDGNERIFLFAPYTEDDDANNNFFTGNFLQASKILKNPTKFDSI